MPAPMTLPNAPVVQNPRPIVATGRTPKTLAPAVRSDRFKTGFVRAKPGLPRQKIRRFLLH